MLVFWLFALAIRAVIAGHHTAIEAARAAAMGPQFEPGDDQFGP
jgi:hypothetical protein